MAAKIGMPRWSTLVAFATESKFKRYETTLLRWPPGSQGRQLRAEIMHDAQRVLGVLRRRAFLEKPKNRVDKHITECVGVHAKVQAQILEEKNPIMSMSLSLCCDETILELNSLDRGVKMPTDVLSYPTFAMLPSKPDVKKDGGDDKTFTFNPNQMEQFMAKAGKGGKGLPGGDFDPAALFAGSENDKEFEKLLEAELDKMGPESEDDQIDLSQYEEEAKNAKYYEGVDAGIDWGHPDVEESAAHIGDLIISVDTAEEQADERGHSLRNEVRVLMVHGVLHLALFDHETPKDEKLMREAEAAFLKELGWTDIEGLVALSDKP